MRQEPTCPCIRLTPSVARRIVENSTGAFGGRRCTATDADGDVLNYSNDWRLMIKVADDNEQVC